MVKPAIKKEATETKLPEPPAPEPDKEGADISSYVTGYNAGYKYATYDFAIQVCKGFLIAGIVLITLQLVFDSRE